MLQTAHQHVDMILMTEPIGGEGGLEDDGVLCISALLIGDGVLQETGVKLALGVQLLDVARALGRVDGALGTLHGVEFGLIALCFGVGHGEVAVGGLDGVDFVEVDGELVGDVLVDGEVGGGLVGELVVEGLGAGGELQGDGVGVVMWGGVGLGKAVGEAALVLDLDDPVAVGGGEGLEGVFEGGFHGGEALAEVGEFGVGGEAERG